MKKVSEYCFNLPEHVWFGEGSSGRLSERLAAHNLIKPFILIDPVVRMTDFGKRILESIKADKCGYTWDAIETNAPRPQVEGAAEKMATYKPDVIIAIGGGSSIDLAKAATVLYAGGGTLDDYFAGEKAIGPLPLLFAIPTTCGTGSEVTPYAVVLDLATKRKRGLGSPYLIPREAFLDVDSLSSLPPYFIAATGVDALCHAVESFVSRKATALTKLAVIGTITGIASHILSAVFDKEKKSLEVLLAASMNSRMFYPQTGLTVAHSMAHPLGAHFGIHHGDAVARMTVPVIKFNAEVAPKPYAELAKSMHIANEADSDSIAARSLADWFENLFSRLNLCLELLNAPHDRENAILVMSQDTLNSSNIPSNPRDADLNSIIWLFNQVIR